MSSVVIDSSFANSAWCVAIQIAKYTGCRWSFQSKSSLENTTRPVMELSLELSDSASVGACLDPRKATRRHQKTTRKQYGDDEDKGSQVQHHLMSV